MTNSLLAMKQTTRSHQHKLHVNMMRRERDKGYCLFVGADCLSSQQIAVYFSCLAATKRKHSSLTTTVVNWEEVEFMDKEQADKHEHDISRKQEVVFSNLQLRHPVTYIVCHITGEPDTKSALFSLCLFTKFAPCSQNQTNPRFPCSVLSTHILLPLHKESPESKILTFIASFIGGRFSVTHALNFQYCV